MYSSIRERQVNRLSNASIRSQLSNSNLVEKLRLERVLERHSGCVNTASFTPCGNSLLSGSDDRKIIMWNWQTGTQRVAYQSGHRNNVFQARALPATHDATIVSCAADGQVRVAYVAEGGRVDTQRLALHNGRAHKLALQPGEPACFLSCGEDGAVRWFDLRETTGSGASRPLLVCRSRSFRSGTLLPPVELNSIHCNGARPFQFVVAGSDAAVRVYDRRMASDRNTSGTTAAAVAAPIRFLMPASMRSSRAREHHVTCAMFTQHSGEIVATYNDEDIYLFASEHRQGAASAASPRRLRRSTNLSSDAPHSKRARGDESDCGSCGGRASPLVTSATPVVSSPVAAPGPRGAIAVQNCTSVDTVPGGADTSARGAQSAVVAPQLGALDPQSSRQCSDSDDDDGDSSVRNHPPPLRLQRPRRNAFMIPTHLQSTDCEQSGAVISSSEDEDAVIDGDDIRADQERDSGEADEVLQQYRGHRNARTVKGVAFAGADDEFVMSGSDCGHMFIWEKVGGKLRACHRGDNSIVNCLEQHPSLPLTIATSGIDNDVKIWTPTAENAASPSANVAALVEANSSLDRRANTVYVTPSMLRRLLAHHALNARFPIGLQSSGDEDSSSQRENSDDFSSGDYEDSEDR